MRTTLEKGEVVCDKCKGKGIINNSTYVVHIPGVPYNITSTTSSESLIGIKCKKCKGEGKLDWIENVTGKKDSLPDHYELDRYYDL